MRVLWRQRPAEVGVILADLLRERPDLAERAHHAIDSGPACLLYRMDMVELAAGRPLITRHSDGSVDLCLRLVPGSAPRVHLLGGSMFVGGAP